MSKTAIVILSDPRSGAEESLGRALNGIAAAYDFKTAGEEITVLFSGAGTRWPEQFKKEDQIGHAIYKEIEDKIAGVSAACSQIFGAEVSGLDLISNNPIPGTPGLPSLVQLQKDGYSVLIF